MHIALILCATTEVVLRFTDEQQTSYEESGLAATVCASLSGAIERTVLAAIIAQNGSATGFASHVHYGTSINDLYCS